ncbi:RES family NAD+ phosphorylase [Bifidobacterium rousetti]|uniref:RES family NAD+ phosphorylase n=1 Tax=Bifidobacterium rousetti TaxID=2045439 RepID=UPI00168BA7A1|nr:RES family NAD+ phosphorylase [Bifidobacterium rousetti]
MVQGLGVQGDCDYCGSEGVATYAFGACADLQYSLLTIIGLYESCGTQTKADVYTLAHELSSRWRLFAIAEETAQELLDTMYAESPKGVFDGYAMDSLLQGMVRLSDDGRVGEHDWDKFADHLKYHNRFFVSFIDIDELARLISYTRDTCGQGTVLTRARIAKDMKGYAAGAEMGAPPQGVAGNGRINPVGISELYTTLGNDDEADDTALHEIRAGMHDYVTFGKFSLKRDITIADLSKLSEISPFDIDSGDLPMFAANLDILRGMTREISKPMRRGDNPLEYIPSQYIAELIKSLGEKQGGPYDGVKYASTLRSGGMNLCLFDPGAYECDKTYTKRVSEVTYSIVR